MYLLRRAPVEEAGKDAEERGGHGRNEKRRIEKTARIEKAWKHRRGGSAGEAGGKKTEGAG